MNADDLETLRTLLNEMKHFDGPGYTEDQYNDAWDRLADMMMFHADRMVYAAEAVYGSRP